MEVGAVLVDDIKLVLDEASATVSSTLYEFPDPQWVSVHHERTGLSIGPFTLVKFDPPRETFGLSSVTRRQFGERSLTVTRSHAPTISYKETWTRPENCVYTLVLPLGCIATQLEIECPGYRYPPSIDVAATPDERIFHYVVLMGEPGILRVSARITSDPKQHKRALADATVVAATDKYGELRQRASSLDFWFKLLTLGGKVFGGP